MTTDSYLSLYSTVQLEGNYAGFPGTEAITDRIMTMNIPRFKKHYERVQRNVYKENYILHTSHSKIYKINKN